jgi:hypothetical protein
MLLLSVGLLLVLPAAPAMASYFMDAKQAEHYWAAGDSRFNPSCSGLATVIGSSESGSYYWRVNFRQGKCPWGTG